MNQLALTLNPETNIGIPGLPQLLYCNSPSAWEIVRAIAE